jgi:hypothetical protein
MRRSLAALTLATAMIAGCGSQPATPTPSASAVATAPAVSSTSAPALGSLRPTTTPTGTPPPSSTAPPPAATVTLPTSAIRTLPTGTFALQRDRAFTLDGAFYPIVGNGARGQTFTIRMVNGASGTSTVLASRPSGREPSSLSVVGDRVVWVESWYAHPQPNVGGETGGNLNAGQPLLWQINTVSISTGAVSVIASGSNTRIPVEGEAAGPLAPVLAADGDRVAYTLDRAGPGGTDASAIIVRSLSSGAVLRRIDADGYVAQVGLTGQALFFREAFDSGAPGSVYPADASLMLSRSDGEPPRLIDTHVSDAAMDTRTLVWSRENATDASIWTTLLPTGERMRVPGPPVAVEPGQQGPSSNLAVGNGVVAWIVGYADANNVAESELVVWNTAQTVGRVIGDQRHLDWVVIEDGLLVWRDYLSLPDTHAVPISAIPVIP